jgi:hypothetical protein
MKRATQSLIRSAESLAVWLVIVMACLLAVPHVAHAAPLVMHSVTGMVPIIGMIAFDWAKSQDVPMNRAQINALIDPTSGNQNEVIPYCLYDTQNIANTNAGPFVFYQAIQSDKTLSNMEGAAQLPDPQVLIVSYCAVDLMQPAFAAPTTAIGNPMSDLYEILFNQRTTFTLTIANKKYGPFPLSTCHGTGGVIANAFAEGATAAGQAIVGAQNGYGGSGGYWFGGAVIIPPKVGWDVTLTLKSGGTAALTTTTAVRFCLFGTLYRRVQ